MARIMKESPCSIRFVDRLVRIAIFSILAAAASLYLSPAHAQIEPAPDRSEGEGPFQRMVLRGPTVIDGTGAPPIGPVDIVVENDRIV